MKLKSVRTGEDGKTATSFPDPCSLSAHTASNKMLTGSRDMPTVHQIKREHNQQNCSDVLLQYNNSDLEVSDIVAMQTLHIKYSCKMNEHHHPNCVV